MPTIYPYPMRAFKVAAFFFLALATAGALGRGSKLVGCELIIDNVSQIVTMNLGELKSIKIARCLDSGDSRNKDLCFLNVVCQREPCVKIDGNFTSVGELGAIADSPTIVKADKLIPGCTAAIGSRATSNADTQTQTTQKRGSGYRIDRTDSGGATYGRCDNRKTFRANYTSSSGWIVCGDGGCSTDLTDRHNAIAKWCGDK